MALTLTCVFRSSSAFLLLSSGLFRFALPVDVALGLRAELGEATDRAPLFAVGERIAGASAISTSGAAAGAATAVAAGSAEMVGAAAVIIAGLGSLGWCMTDLAGAVGSMEPASRKGKGSHTGNS